MPLGKGEPVAGSDAPPVPKGVAHADTTRPSAFSPDEQRSAVEPPAPPDPGALIGGVYRVTGSLGSGAMGVVLLAHDQGLDRDVAIKVVRPELLGVDFRRRFSSEAQAMARVNHPNVLQIYASGEHDDAPYFVMELVRGPTLEDWLAESKPWPPLETALRVLDELCQGVAAIHAAGALHRDLKPSNILLGGNFRPRVADLGLAVLIEGKQKPEIVGTPAYMAPEIAFGGHVDPEMRQRADVYSLGCIAYQLLTGQPPFDAETNLALMFEHATTDVTPPSTLRAELPAGFDAPIIRALAKKPGDRTPSVDAFRLELIAGRHADEEPIRILVAEDDADFRGSLELILAREFPHAEIECVADGGLALAAFDRAPPSVAIIDLEMPNLDGMELTALLRSRATSIAVPIIVLTGSGGPQEWKRLSALGADRFLVKPVNLDDLLTLVRRALRERGHASLRPAP